MLSRPAFELIRIKAIGRNVRCPHTFGFPMRTIAKRIVHGEPYGIEKFCVINGPACGIMCPHGPLGKGTNRNAISALSTVINPETQAFLKVIVPLQNAGAVANRWPAPGLFAVGDRFGGAFPGAFFTVFAKFLHTEFNRFVHNQGHVGQNLIQSD